MIIAGILIGFWGYLMVGNINLSIVELSTHEVKQKLIQFITFTILFESLYCFVTLYCLQLLMAFPTIIHIARYASVVFLFFIGFWSILEKNNSAVPFHANIVRRGYWSMIIHPQQISFWFFWGIILIQKGVLHIDVFSVFLFTIANAIGVFLILLCYACYGKKIFFYLNLNRKQLKFFVGIICISSALLLLRTMFCF
jgi:hypothetical protein